jgi:hypothetical protein
VALTVRKGPSRSECESTLKPSPWDLGNDVLYDLCRRYPHHRLPAEIIAKVWLIGRAYAAPVERGRPNDGTSSESFYAQTLVRKDREVRWSSLDARLEQIDAMSHCETSEDAAAVPGTHDSLSSIFREASGRSNRSLQNS